MEIEKKKKYIIITPDEDKVLYNSSLKVYAYEVVTSKNNANQWEERDSSECPRQVEEESEEEEVEEQ